jgi:hypothetical protein
MIIVTAKVGLLSCRSKGQLHQPRCPLHRKHELRFWSYRGIHHLPIWRRRFVENGAHSFAIEPQTESILRCKLRDLCFPISLIQWPKACQVLLVNRAVAPLLAMHPLFDLSRQRFHCFAFHLEVDCSKSAQNEESSSRGALNSTSLQVTRGSS